MRDRNLCTRVPLSCFLAAAFLTFVPFMPLVAQTPNCDVSLTDAAAAPGEIATTDVLLTNSITIAGWSFGVAHDPAEATIESVVLGVDIAPPSFVQLSLYDNGWTIGVVLSVTGAWSLPPGDSWRLHAASYTLRGAIGDTALLCFSDSLGEPPIGIGFAPPSISVITTHCGFLSVSQSQFVRGDCNDNGVTDISDAIHILGYLFLAVSPPTCVDACDASDGGTFDIADAVAILDVLFLGGPPLDHPFPFCGVDHTEDEFGCAEYSACP